MNLERRRFLQSAAALSMAAPAYGALSGCAASSRGTGRGDLVADPRGWLDLPDGFTYQRLGPTGMEMNDGLLVPARHDGMGCFAGPDADRVTLVRNHEMKPGRGLVDSAFGDNGERLDRFDMSKAWDTDAEGRPMTGGTTTMVYNLKSRELERIHLSIAGTSTNCAGGVTPWGTWLTCEETTVKVGSDARKDHGYVFEVDATYNGLTIPVALKDMGRFDHEAAAVDPSTGIVYMTEDDKEGLLYRFIPHVRGDLTMGGRLQALRVQDQPSLDTRNWGDGPYISSGQSFACTWIDLENVQSPDGDLRFRGFNAGAARFARGEGAAWAISPGQGNAVYFACTTGGKARKGQIWSYAPGEMGGTLTLQYESPNAETMDMCDNIVAAPWGHLIVCEDGDQDEYVHGLRPDGTIYTIARNAHPGKSELAGACFSPDGSTLFVNVQTPGATYAITGPWARLAMA